MTNTQAFGFENIEMERGTHLCRLLHVLLTLAQWQVVSFYIATPQSFVRLLQHLKAAG
jgi:hypothetical protein